MKRFAAALGVIVILGAACAGQESDPGTDGGVSLSIGDVGAAMDGNVARIPVETEGIELVRPDGRAATGKGHFAVFVDRDPVDPGERIPAREVGVLQTHVSPIRVFGLSVGEHTFTVVLADGARNRIGDVSAQVQIDVRGPSVRATAPATIEAGQDLTIDLEAEGVTIGPADGDTSGTTGHYHVLVNPETVPAPGETIPAPEENRIIHTPEDQVTIPGLEAGNHTIWVLLGDGEHVAFTPRVGDRLTVRVTEA